MIETRSIHGIANGKFESRFWNKVDKSGDCWIWQGAHHGHGYGLFSLDGVNERAHRVSWYIAHGDLPKGAIVRHKCDNTACVNPDHLEIGTQMQNVEDCVSKGRHREDGAPDGEGNGQAKLTWDEVDRIRSLRSIGATHKDLSLMFGVSIGAIGHIVKNRTWTNRPL